MQDLENIKIGQKIGTGLNGEVYQCQTNADSLGIHNEPMCAIKVFKSASEFQCEQDVLTDLDHPNVIKVLQMKNNKMLMKYYENGDLFDFLQSDGRQIISENVARYFFKQILKAIEYIHQKNIVHRDIKLENILVDKDFNLILSDFGLSTKIERGQMLNEYIGTSSYMAPEIVAQCKYYGQSTDIFALGVILFCIMVGTYPFQNQAVPTDHHYKYFANKNYIRYWLLVEKQCQRTFSPSFKQLINQMLSYDVDERITMEEIWEHEWVNGPTATPQQIQQALMNIQIQKQQQQDQQKEFEQQQKQHHANTQQRSEECRVYCN